MRLAWDSVRHVEKAEGDYQREPSHALYHTARWAKLSKAWKRSHPLCERCKAKGLLAEADVTDHVIPFPICDDFFDKTNLQSLCKRCNFEKGIEDRPKIQRWKAEHPGWEKKYVKH